MCNQKKKALENLDITTKPTSNKPFKNISNVTSAYICKPIKCATNQQPLCQYMVFMHVLMDYVVQTVPSFMSFLVSYVMCSRICLIMDVMFLCSVLTMTN